MLFRSSVSFPVTIPHSMKVYLNGTDVSNYINSYTIDIPRTGIRTATIVTIRSIEDTYTITNGDIIEIQESLDDITWTTEFYGIILTKTNDLSGYALSCSDEMWKATGQTITKLYDTSDPYDVFGGDIREIMIDIVNHAGLTMDDTTIDQTSVTIPQVLCDGVKVMEKIEQLQNIMYWDVYQDPADRKIYFKK